MLPPRPLPDKEPTLGLILYGSSNVYIFLISSIVSRCTLPLLVAGYNLPLANFASHLANCPMPLSPSIAYLCLSSQQQLAHFSLRPWVMPRTIHSPVYIHHFHWLLKQLSINAACPLPFGLWRFALAVFLAWHSRPDARFLSVYFFSISHVGLLLAPGHRQRGRGART